MAKTRINVDIVTTKRHHGSKGPQPRNVSSGVASKFRSAQRKQDLDNISLQKGSEESKNQGQGNDPKDLFTYNPKPYGSHNGNTHVDRIFDNTFESLSDAISKSEVIVANTAAKLESLSSYDIRAEKAKYSAHKQAVLENYQRSHGSSVSAENLPQIQSELSKQSFYYCSHQVRVTITSEENFSGAKAYQRADGTFVYQISYLSKTYYTYGSSLLSDNLRNTFRELSTDEKMVIKTTKARCTCHITTNSKGLYVISFDNDSGFFASSPRGDY